MYGIVEIGGHQYRVQAGDVIDVQKLETEAGKDVTFDKVLFVGGKETKVGAPTVSGATVKARVIRHDRSRKVFVSTRKPGRYFKKNGHRQPFTSLLITEVAGEKLDAGSDAAKKYLK